MSGFKWKNIVGGLNFQFIAYFLLFAYLPLLAFSIIGYHLNKGLIHQVHQDNLLNQAQKTERHIHDYLALKKEKIRQLYEIGHLCVGPDHLPEFSTIIVSDGQQVTHHKSIHSGIENVVDSLKTNINALYYESNSEQVFFQSSPAKGIIVWAGLPANVLRTLLQSDDPHTRFYLRSEGGSKRISLEGDLAGIVVADEWSLFSHFRDDTVLECSLPFLPQWSVVATRSAQGLYGELERFLNEILLGNLIIGLLMFGIAVILARRMTNPIRQLVLSANKFSRGDLSTPVEVSGSEEINILSSEFERMRQKLLESYANLEEKIDQRTEALREAQFQISHQEKMASLGLLAAGVAHEIGNPLTGISSMAQIIKRRIKDDDIEEYVNTILSNIDRISRIVRELVDFTRPSNYEAALVQVNKVIESAVGIARYDKRAKNIELERDLKPGLPALFLVEDQLLQVFINILINAMDACPNDNARLKIKTYSENGNVHMHFTDNGIGIKPEDQAKIFEPFFTTKKVGKGTGLGLSVSYGIIRNLNGKISVLSKPGQGSTFKIEIPLNPMETIHES